MMKTQQFFSDYSNTVQLKLLKNYSQTIEMNEAADYGENSNIAAKLENSAQKLLL